VKTLRQIVEPLFLSDSERKDAFTLVELLLVLAVLSIMSALVVTAVTNAAGDARMVVARQQQAVLQEALNAWVSKESMGSGGLLGAMGAYNSASSASAKLGLLSNYLDAGTYANFTTNGGGGIQTDDMQRIGVSLNFTSGWTTNNYPRVEMQ
jgi:prepilin-type N-terminal cleavage/methylation domain-containing protein